MTSWTVQYPKQEGDKVNWPKVGMAFLNEETGRIDVKLDSLPLPQFWPDAKLVLYPVKEKGK